MRCKSNKAEAEMPAIMFAPEGYLGLIDKLYGLERVEVISLVAVSINDTPIQ